MLQFYRDRDHAEEVAAKMMTMQDESMGQLMKEFDGLVTQGSSFIMGGFTQLKVAVVEIIAASVGGNSAANLLLLPFQLQF
jgi:hypothetical protein